MKQRLTKHKSFTPSLYFGWNLKKKKKEKGEIYIVRRNLFLSLCVTDYVVRLITFGDDRSTRSIESYLILFQAGGIMVAP